MAEGGHIPTGRAGRARMLEHLMGTIRRPGEVQKESGGNGAPQPSSELPKARPVGRAALLAAFLEKKKPEGDRAVGQIQAKRTDPVSLEQHQPGPSGDGPPIGQGAVPKIRPRVEARTTPPSVSPVGGTSEVFTSSSSSSGRSLGRGRAVGVALEAISVGGSCSSSVMSSKTAPSEAFSQMVIEKPSGPPVVRRGTCGNVVQATANYIRLEVEGGKGVFEYEVTFQPDVDAKNMRFHMMREQTEVLGTTRTFDGAKLYLPFSLPQKVTKLTGHHPIDNIPVTITISLKHQKSLGNCIQLYNTIFNKIMGILKMVKVGPRNFYNPKGIHISQHNLEVWPGYVTSVQEYEGGLLLCCDVSHKVLRTRTAYDAMVEIMDKCQHTYQEEIVKQVVGATVMTRYNNKTYRVDDVQWTQSPKDTFEKGDGSQMSYIEYYKSAYGFEIKDNNQPLLLHNLKKKEKGMERTTQLISLIPELCYLTGLSDQMRANYSLMKDINKYTKLNPHQRQMSLQSFVNNIKGNEDAKKQLSQWGLKLSSETIPLEARILPCEDIQVRGKKITDHNADWGNQLTRSNILQAVALHSWVLIYAQNDALKAKDFAQQIVAVANQMGMKMSYPRMVQLPGQRPSVSEFVKMLHNCINPNLELVTIIMPTSRDDLYSAIKKICCAEKPIPSQVIVARTLGNPRKLRAVSQKIALQMNCKLGGSLWAVDIPVQHLMVIGIDVYHEGIAKNKKSVMGFVASMNHVLTKWYSVCAFQEPGHEIIDSLKRCLVQAMRKYHEVNHCYPRRIVVYRDGVSEGQFDVCAAHEVQQLFSSLKSIYVEEDEPKFSFVIVQKRINTRLYLKAHDRFDNPPPGTVMDHTITKKQYYDFFLVSQLVREGTVSPTHYVVIFENISTQPNVMQRLAHKMTHLYYNWPGTVRVPAPCQYAHKLAYLIGQNVRKAPSDELTDRLYYL